MHSSIFPNFKSFFYISVISWKKKVQLPFASQSLIKIFSVQSMSISIFNDKGCYFLIPRVGKDNKTQKSIIICRWFYNVDILHMQIGTLYLCVWSHILHLVSMKTMAIYFVLWNCNCTQKAIIINILTCYCLFVKWITS